MLWFSEILDSNDKSSSFAACSLGGKMQTYQGSCHCGAVAFEIDAVLTEFTTCDCSLCRKKNAVMTKVHESAFRLLKGKNVLGLYEWNAHIAKHHFCNSCGI